MQGFIIRIQPSRDEDLIVSILTKDTIHTAYRFYGARHSTINLGYKIDAELVHSLKSSMPQLRNVMHLSHSWQYENHKMITWQNFIQLFYKHLRGIEQVDEFYFLLLDEICQKMHKQNPKRLQIEAYAKLLEYEGRLHEDKICFLCEQKITQDITLTRAYLPTHASCISSVPMNFDFVNDFLKTKSTILLDNAHVDRLWNVMLEGF